MSKSFTIHDLPADERPRERLVKFGIVGYEIPVTRYFDKYEEPRKVEEIENEIKEVEQQIEGLLKGIGKGFK